MKLIFKKKAPAPTWADPGGTIRERLISLVAFEIAHHPVTFSETPAGTPLTWFVTTLDGLAERLAAHRNSVHKALGGGKEASPPLVKLVVQHDTIFRDGDLSRATLLRLVDPSKSLASELPVDALAKQMAAYWKAVTGKSATRREFGMLKGIARSCGENAPEYFAYTVKHWQKFKAFAHYQIDQWIAYAEAKGSPNVFYHKAMPDEPSIPWIRFAADCPADAGFGGAGLGNFVATSKAGGA